MWLPWRRRAPAPSPVPQFAQNLQQIAAEVRRVAEEKKRESDRREGTPYEPRRA